MTAVPRHDEWLSGGQHHELTTAPLTESDTQERVDALHEEAMIALDRDSGIFPVDP